MTLMPYAVGIHTTTPQLGLCCSHPERGISIQTWDLGRDMSTQLHEHLFSFMSAEDLSKLQFIAVASGPGGFTSTRLGVVTARTLAQQLNIPLFGISSLAAYVWHRSKLPQSPQDGSAVEQNNSMGKHHHHSDETMIAVQMPARRHQVFGAIYKIARASKPNVMTSQSTILSPQTLAPYKADHVINEEDWKSYIETEFTEPLTRLTINEVLGYTVPSVLELATLDYRAQTNSHWSTVLPFYGQSPV